MIEQPKALSALAALALYLSIFHPSLPAAEKPDMEATAVDESSETLTQEMDENIRRQVLQILTQDEDLVIYDLRVTVSKGAVILYGQVNTSIDKHLASRYADNVDGTEGIINRLKVLPGLDERDSEPSPTRD